MLTLSIIDYAGFIWSVIKDLINGIIEIINFIKNLVLSIPDFLDFLPTEISVMLITAIGIIMIISIFKFIK